MEDLVITEHLIVPAAEMDLVFARSGGPGGQNVNKVNTKATLCWNINNSTVLYPTAMARLRALAGSKLTDAGILQITSQVHREQPRNIQACRERLKNLILEAMKPPTIRRPTQPTRGSQRRRIEDKKNVAQKKQNRSTNNWE